MWTSRVVVRQEQPGLSRIYWSLLVQCQMSVVLCLQRFPIKHRELSHMTAEAATRTAEAATLATFLLPQIWGVFVLPNWDNTSAGSWCSAAMSTLSELTRVTRVVLSDTVRGLGARIYQSIPLTGAHTSTTIPLTEVPPLCVLSYTRRVARMWFKINLEYLTGRLDLLANS